MFESEVDPATGLGLVMVAGTLTEAERAECLLSLKQLSETTRSRFGSARILLDASGAYVQPREIAVAVDMSTLLHAEGDRMAVVVSSALHSMQARRVLAEARVSFFSSRAEAVAWLESPDTSVGAPS